MNIKKLLEWLIIVPLAIVLIIKTIGMVLSSIGDSLQGFVDHIG